MHFGLPQKSLKGAENTVYNKGAQRTPGYMKIWSDTEFFLD